MHDTHTASEIQSLRKAMQRCLPLARPWSGIIYRLRGSSMRLRGSSCRALAASGMAAGGTPWGALKRSMRARCRTRPWMKPLPTTGTLEYRSTKPSPESSPISAKLSNALNLTDGKVRQQLRVSLSKLLGEDWREQQDRGNESLTQAIGRAAFETGLEALLVRWQRPVTARAW